MGGFGGLEKKQKKSKKKDKKQYFLCCLFFVEFDSYSFNVVTKNNSQ
jgi:hypothetical protein